MRRRYSATTRATMGYSAAAGAPAPMTRIRPRPCSMTDRPTLNHTARGSAGTRMATGRRRSRWKTRLIPPNWNLCRSPVTRRGLASREKPVTTVKLVTCSSLVTRRSGTSRNRSTHRAPGLLRCRPMTRTGANRAIPSAPATRWTMRLSRSTGPTAGPRLSHVTQGLWATRRRPMDRKRVPSRRRRRGPAPRPSRWRGRRRAGCRRPLRPLPARPRHQTA